MANLWRRLFGGGTNPIRPDGPDEELSTDPEPSLEEPVSLYPGKVKWTYEEIVDDEGPGDIGFPKVEPSDTEYPKVQPSDAEYPKIQPADAESELGHVPKVEGADELGHIENEGVDELGHIPKTSLDFDSNRWDTSEPPAAGVSAAPSEPAGADDDANPFDMDYKPVDGEAPSPMDQRELPAVQKVSDAADEDLAHELSDGEGDELPAVQSEAPDEEPSTLLNLHATPDLKELTESDFDFDAEGPDVSP
jgi:hypothetical protein